MLLLIPLVTTDVIVFARRATGTSNNEVVLIRLLIDNEAYDAVPVRG